MKLKKLSVVNTRIGYEDDDNYNLNENLTKNKDAYDVRNLNNRKDRRSNDIFDFT